MKPLSPTGLLFPTKTLWKRDASPLLRSDKDPGTTNAAAPLESADARISSPLFLPGLPADLIRRCYDAAPGNEITSGKFGHPESSAALVANAFGVFLERPEDLPCLVPGQSDEPILSVMLEATVRFPWSEGRHPCLDVLVETASDLIGIESKRYEPYRNKPVSTFSDAYWRKVWGADMGRYEQMRDTLHRCPSLFTHLDGSQLLKHAFALRTAVHHNDRLLGKAPVLIYLYAEPSGWPDGRAMTCTEIEAHRQEIMHFASSVDGDEVAFEHLSYDELLSTWRRAGHEYVRRHADAIANRFAL